MAQPSNAKAIDCVPKQQCLFSCSPFTQMLLELLDVHDELLQFPCSSRSKDTMLGTSWYSGCGAGSNTGSLRDYGDPQLLLVFSPV